MNKLLWEWKTGHFPESKITELPDELGMSEDARDRFFDQIKQIPYNKSKGEEATFDELKQDIELQEDLTNNYRGRHIEWREYERDEE
jgi:hypothetical protein